MTGAEVTEAINVLYNGDLRYAKVSELGLFSGEDQTVTGADGNNVAMTYTEAVFVQLALHYCYLGTDLSNAAATEDFALTLGSADTLFL